MQSQTLIVPRSKNADGTTQQLPVVVLTLATLEQYFLLPLNEAAKQLGVCETSLKRCEVIMIRYRDDCRGTRSLMMLMLTFSILWQRMQKNWNYKMALPQGDLKLRKLYE